MTIPPGSRNLAVISGASAKLSSSLCCSPPWTYDSSRIIPETQGGSVQEIPLDFDPNQFLAGALVVLGLAGVSVFYLRARIMTCLRRVKSFLTVPGLPATGPLGALVLLSFAALCCGFMRSRG